MAYWWVNQKQTWRHEISGEYLWSPKTAAGGRRSIFYDNMTLLEPGDIVLSYFDGALRYAGVVVSRAVSEPKPDFGFAGNTWSDDGWSVEMRFAQLPIVVQPQEHLQLYDAVKPERYGPMNNAGRVNQQYLFAIPSSLGEHYLKTGGLSSAIVNEDAKFDPSVDLLLHEAETVLADTNLTATEKHVLARARIGQGFFKEEVRRLEPVCRITGVSEPRHLIASHMKPWSNSDNSERLDGNNGLLLSPHVDHLFDRGFITFERNGKVVASSQLNTDIVKRWKLDLTETTRRFRSSQIPYLEFHQEHIFRSN